MNLAQWSADWQAQLTRAAIFWTALELAAFIVGMWVLYLVVKAAVRDGIEESGLARSMARAASVSSSKGEHLPDMRAD